jgi:hypothetical protein
LEGNVRDNLKVRDSYGVAEGPRMVAVQERRELGEGKAERPGVGESIRVRSSDWRL